MSLEFDVLLSGIREGKSVISSGVGSGIKKDLLKQRARKTSAVDAALPEGRAVTEIKKKSLKMKAASKGKRRLATARRSVTAARGGG